MNKIVSLILGILLIGLFTSIALADTPEFGSKIPENDPGSDQGEPQGF